MDTTLDMHLPEAFHRLKRTVMVFAAIMTVLGLTTVANPANVKLELVELSVAASTLKILLQIGATYYLAGFVLEFRLAHALNTDVLRSAGASSLNEVFGRLAVRLEEATAAVDQVQEPIIFYKEMVERQVAQERKLFDDGALAGAVAHVLAEGRQWSGRSADEVAANQRQRFEALFLPGQTAGDLTGRMNEMAIKLGDFHARLPHIESDMKKAQASLGRLSPAIGLDRRVSFWVWEGASAALAYLMATIIMWGWPTTVWNWLDTVR